MNNAFARIFGACLTRRCRCKEQCKAIFANNIQLRNGCEAACTADPRTDPRTYLCGTAEQTTLIQALGADPCPKDEIGIDDAFNTELVDLQSVDFTPFYIGGAAIIAILLILFFNKK